LSDANSNALFGRERSVITKHLRNIFQEGELGEDSVCANFAHTAKKSSVRPELVEGPWTSGWWFDKLTTNG